MLTLCSFGQWTGQEGKQGDQQNQGGSKRVASLVMVVLIACAGTAGLLASSQAQAQAQAQQQRHCVSAAMLQRNAAQSYLVRLTELGGSVPVDGNAYAGARNDVRGARFEVLKVYSGDVEELSELAHAMLEINCSSQWNMGCSILEEHNYPFYKGQMFVLYDKPNADGVVVIKLGPCPGSKRFMNNVQDVREFEAMYPPVWESKAWLREFPAGSRAQAAEVVNTDPVGDGEGEEAQVGGGAGGAPEGGVSQAEGGLPPEIQRRMDELRRRHPR